MSKDLHPDDRSRKTKFQRLVFTLLMVLFMVYCMCLYNTGRVQGFSYASFAVALRSMWLEVPAALMLQHFVGAPLASRLLPGIVDPASERRGLVQVAMAGCMVLIMAPCMTLFVSIVRGGFTADLLVRWLPLLVVNFPFAFFIQIFLAGPVVRFVHRSIFRRHAL